MCLQSVNEIVVPAPIGHSWVSHCQQLASGRDLLEGWWYLSTSLPSGLILPTAVKVTGRLRIFASNRRCVKGSLQATAMAKTAHKMNVNMVRNMRVKGNNEHRSVERSNTASSSSQTARLVEVPPTDAQELAATEGWRAGCLCFAGRVGHRSRGAK